MYVGEDILDATDCSDESNISCTRNLESEDCFFDVDDTRSLMGSPGWVATLEGRR